MSQSKRIHNLIKLGEGLRDMDTPFWESIIAQAQAANGWFTKENIVKSITAVRDEYLSAEKLAAWADQYATTGQPKTVAIIMAGNIPLVGIHDLICSYVAGHKTIIKCSSKDNVLIKAIVKQLQAIDLSAEETISIVEKLQGYDAVIATGGDTAATHFAYYFSKYPHIIRKNRNSITILNGQESDSDLHSLGADVFDYFGLGCRSVSKVYIPEDFNTDRLFEAFADYHDIIHHHKYKNNFDYNHAIYVLTQQPFLTNDMVILREDPSIASRIACLHYERYTHLDTLLPELDAIKDKIQCISSSAPLQGWAHIPLGQCQKPGLNDYADNVDTMEFLTTLS